MKCGNYRVYKLINDGDSVTLYFPEVDTVVKKVKVQKELDTYRKSGYQIACVLFVDKETYLNLRIDETVHNILKADNYEQEIKDRYNNREMSIGTYYESLEANNAWRKSNLDKLEKQMKRLLFYEEMNCTNEIAVELFNRIGSNAVISKNALWLE